LFKNLNIKLLWIEFMNRIQEYGVWLGLVDSDTLVFFLYLFTDFYFFTLEKSKMRL